MPEIYSPRPGVWLVESEAEDFQVRGAVLVGTDRAVVWDTLSRPKDMEGVGDLIGDLPFTVIYSHGDWDHVWGTAGLPPAWDEILAHEIAADRFTDEIPATLAEKRSVHPETYERVRLHPPTGTIRRSLKLDLGGATLELRHFPGHTPDSIVGYIPAWGVLLAGDAVETPLPFLNPGSPVRAWVDRLTAWEKTLMNRSVPPLVIPSHGRIGGTELLHSNASYLQALAEGREPDLQGDLTPFYRETHDSNRVLARDEKTR